jgi:hypothetical protein
MLIGQSRDCIVNHFLSAGIATRFSDAIHEDSLRLAGSKMTLFDAKFSHSLCIPSLSLCWC